MVHGDSCGDECCKLLEAVTGDLWGMSVTLTVLFCFGLGAWLGWFAGSVRQIKTVSWSVVACRNYKHNCCRTARQACAVQMGFKSHQH
jgi:hypothetical protein